jgi:hypothetical protein
LKFEINENFFLASRSQHAGVENAEALPNPWSRVVNQQQPGQGQGTTNAGAEGGGLPFTRKCLLYFHLYFFSLETNYKF